MSQLKSKKSLAQLFKDEFRLENFSLNFELNSQFQKMEPEKVLEYFHSIFWPNCNKLLYLIYRISIAVYYTIWLIESIFRNAEYRKLKLKIATSINVLKKDNINIFLIHPWPFYMTSWSLLVLFFHLWVTAFIALYFYSINQKSCLAKFFSFIFGPFSCSKRVNTTPNDNYPVDCFRSSFLKKNTNDNHNQMNPEENSLTVTDKYNEDVSHTSTRVSDLNIPTDNVNMKTYCDKQSKCKMPSASVISNGDAWRLWINVHVPKFILVLIKISWLLYNIVIISAIVVSFVYISYVYFANFPLEPTIISELGNWHRHGINSIGK
jgi:hypothetical protein